MENLKRLLGEERSDPPPQEEILRALCADVADQLNANLVSVWNFNTGMTQIECQWSAHRDSGVENAMVGTVLRKEDYPQYFEAITENITIAAPDVRTHYATQCLIEDYFEPNDIVSLLDFIVHRNDIPIGVVCCENKGVRRDWTDEDISHLRMLTVVAARYFMPKG